MDTPVLCIIHRLQCAFKVNRFPEVPEEDRVTFVKTAMLLLTRSLYTPFNWGLSQKIFTDGVDPLQEFKYILKEHKTPLIECPYNLGRFNMNYFNQLEYTKVHRSGWQYVLTHLQRHSSSECKLLLDTSVDRSFGWEQAPLEKAGILPYKQEWMGIIHHTFDTTFSDYNCVALFKNPVFIESLEHCKSLIVMSSYLRAQVKAALNSIGKCHVPVQLVFHPTEIQVQPFTTVETKTLVHVGSFLRNTFRFYALEVPGVKKMLLSNSGCGKLIPNTCCPLGPENGPTTCPSTPTCCPRTCCSSDPTCCPTTCPTTCPSVSNIFHHKLNQFIEEMVQSVEIISHLNDDAYDTFLTDKVVFLDLIDASACNTLIESMVRFTPVIVNKIEPVVELLGPDYPLYFENDISIIELSRFVQKVFEGDLIRKAHLYLRQLNMQRLGISEFISKVKQISYC